MYVSITTLFILVMDENIINTFYLIIYDIIIMYVSITN